jgi:hypothetical protein
MPIELYLHFNFRHNCNDTNFNQQYPPLQHDNGDANEVGARLCEQRPQVRTLY